MAAANTKDMTHGVPWRLIAGFAIPIFLSQLFQQLYNTADSLIVSNFLGDNALAAVSASGPLIFLLISFSPAPPVAWVWLSPATSAQGIMIRCPAPSTPPCCWD